MAKTPHEYNMSEAQRDAFAVADNKTATNCKLYSVRQMSPAKVLYGLASSVLASGYCGELKAWRAISKIAMAIYLTVESMLNLF